MPDLLVRTKFYLPPARPDQVLRARLTDKLASAVSGPLTLISAPAGFGKTTLISQGIQNSSHGDSLRSDLRFELSESRGRVAWLSLDSEDDEPVRFLQYLIEAIETAVPGVASEAANLLRSSPPPAPRTIIGALLNGLAACAEQFLLVLDDYHLIANPAIHDAVAYLIDHLPPHIHLVLITRSDPPLPLGRFRARGQMTEIRAADLRFTAEETAQFLNERMGLGLSAQAVEALEARTEGWIAGLRLAGLSLSGRADKESYVQAFTGSNRYLVEYLVEEVISRQSPEVQEFLLATSILERMCPPLCDAVLTHDKVPVLSRAKGRMTNDENVQLPSSSVPRPSSSVLLEQLEQSNLFLVPLDEEGYWYRYHHLFRDFLRARLAKTRPEGVAALHRAASAWHESQDMLNQAFKHALQTGDWEFAAGVVERNGNTLMGRSQADTLYEWCSAFPEAFLQTRPVLCIHYAWSRTTSFRSDYHPFIEKHIALAERLVSTIDRAVTAQVVPSASPVSLRDWVEGNVALIRSMMLLIPNGRFNSQDQLALSQKAYTLLPAADRHNRSVSAMNVAFAHLEVNDVPASNAALADGLRLTLEGHHYYGATVMAFYMARVAYWRGQLQRAAEICREERKTFERLFANPRQDLPAIRSLDVPWAVLQLEWNDLAGAEETLMHALDFIGWATWVELIGYVALARLREIQGNHAAAEQAIDLIDRLGPDMQRCTEARRMLHRVRYGGSDARPEVNAWAEAHRADWDPARPAPGMGPRHCDIDYITYLTWAQVQLAVGHPDAALAFITPLLQDAQDKGLMHRVIELSLLEAQARQLQGETKRAFDALERALVAAEPEGYIRIFDQGPMLTGLLVEAARRGISRDYIARILSGIGGPEIAETNDERRKTKDERRTVETHSSSVPSSVEPLSARELEILQLVAAGLSNAEIAAKLYIEVATVKRHINHIFGKFDVTNRVQAIARARAIGILD